MKALRVFLIGTFVLFFATAALAQREFTPKPNPDTAPNVNKGTRWALLVGINTYDDREISSLLYCVNDVVSFRDLLVNPVVAEFDPRQVYTMTDQEQGDLRPTNANVILYLERMAKRIGPNDTFVFYFSGHGIVENDEAFLLSINTDRRSMRTLRVTAIPLQEIQDIISSMKARQIFMVIDACRNDPTKGRGDADNLLTQTFVRGIQVAPKKNATLDSRIIATLFACSVGERAYERDDVGHGVFSYYLLEGLKGKAAEHDGEVTAFSLAQYVEHQVVTWTQENKLGRSQTPWLEHKGGTELVLVTLPHTLPITTTPAICRLDIVQPEGFSVFLNNKDTKQETPTLLTLSAGRYILRLERPGYHPIGKVVALGPDHPLETIRAAAIPVTPKEKPGFGLLYIKAFAENKPTSATVSIDGQGVDPVPYTNTAIATGAHKVRVRKPLYHDYVETVTVVKDRKHTVVAVLKPAFGSLEIKSAPSGAKIDLTGPTGTRRGSGITPFQLNKIPSGTYQIRVSKDRYHSNKRAVVIQDGRATTESFSLKPRFGKLVVKSDPNGATVLLTGRKLGTTPLTTDVGSGLYALELHKELYLSWSGEVEVRDGKKTSISERLPPNFGTLKVQVKPKGSEIIVGGTRMGYTPATLKLYPGNHRVEIKNRDKYIPLVRTSLFVGRNQTERLTGNLERKMGTLLVTSTPQEAQINIGGKDYGLTPNVIPLPAGIYKLKVSKASKKEGLRDHEEVIKITWGQKVEKNIKLPAEPPPRSVVRGKTLESNGDKVTRRVIEVLTWPWWFPAVKTSAINGVSMSATTFVIISAGIFGISIGVGVGISIYVSSTFLFFLSLPVERGLRYIMILFIGTLTSRWSTWLVFLFMSN